MVTKKEKSECVHQEDLSYYEVPKIVKFRPDWFGDKHGNS